jgi:hypothetical protein
VLYWLYVFGRRAFSFGELKMFRFHKRTRVHYWSLSKLANNLRSSVGITNPKALTMEAWEEHHRVSSAKAPFTYWLTKKFFNKVQNFILWPSDLFHSIKVFYKNWKGKTHVLDCNLPVGQWSDLTHRIFIGPFTELVKYIEIEKGLETLDWELGLVIDEQMGALPDNPKYGLPSSQAIAAREQKELYLWFKTEYLTRTDEDYSKEDEWFEEDTEMLVRLVRIRNSLWT